MGQYYTPYLEDVETGEITTLYSHEYGSGLKLMEHSYLGNDFVNAALTLIEDHPMIVAWVGDYALDVDCDEDVYNACWRSDDEFKKCPDYNEYFDYDEDKDCYIGRGYLVNHTKKELIDLKAYAPKALDKWGYITNPLPLLTAIGNGQGGGDYHSCHQNFDQVGIWALNQIEFSQSKYKPEGFTDITEEVIFREDGR